MCLAVEESVDYVLVHCLMSQHVWNSILSGSVVGSYLGALATYLRLRNSKLVPQKVKYTALVVFGYYLEGKECTVFFFFGRRKEQTF